MSNKLEIIKHTCPETISIHNDWIEKRDAILDKSTVLVKITEQQDFEDAEILLKKITKTSNELEKMRKLLAAPFQDTTKKIKALADKAREILESEKSRLKGIMVAYHKEVEAKRKAEEERIRQEQAKKEAEAKESDNPFDEIIAEQETEKPIQLETPKVDRFMSRVTKTWKFEVVDSALVPKQFCSPDEKKIRQAVKNGSREIPGIKIFEVESISSR